MKQAKDIINVPLEVYVRDVVGAPTREEEEHCICGARLDNSTPDCYEHMTKGY
jgi:hypothetical protein|tara:strand:- start:1297 stop:1455 length:159 start_codon:yes stop_codon:yes gene_type:complete